MRFGQPLTPAATPSAMAGGTYSGSEDQKVAKEGEKIKGCVGLGL